MDALGVARQVGLPERGGVPHGDEVDLRGATQQVGADGVEVVGAVTVGEVVDAAAEDAHALLHGLADVVALALQQRAVDGVSPGAAGVDQDDVTGGELSTLGGGDPGVEVGLPGRGLGEGGLDGSVAEQRDGRGRLDVGRSVDEVDRCAVPRLGSVALVGTWIEPHRNGPPYSSEQSVMAAAATGRIRELSSAASVDFTAA